MNQVKKIGSLVIDTGQLIFCDPSYLHHWKQDAFEGKRVYKDINTEILYTYMVDFQKFTDILLDNKSVNDLIEAGRLVRIPYQETGEFSNSAVIKGILNKGYTHCKFPAGFDGMAIAVGVPNGDGELPVFAEYKDDVMVKLWIDFETPL